MVYFTPVQVANSHVFHQTLSSRRVSNFCTITRELVYLTEFDRLVNNFVW